MTTIRLTMAQALTRYLAAQTSEVDGCEVPLFAGVFAILGHGNVAGLGEALYGARERLPTLRAHNEQAMGLAAVAFAKANRRRRMMACTSSIGPGATNMLTAAAVAHANRLPLLLLPGDVFASRRPDPVLQQVEAFGDPTISVNDCFRAGLALVGPHYPPGANPRKSTASPAGADRPGRLRAGDARLTAGRTDGGLRLPAGILCPSLLAFSSAAARSRSARRDRSSIISSPCAADYRRWRGTLCDGLQNARRFRSAVRRTGGRDT